MDDDVVFVVGYTQYNCADARFAVSQGVPWNSKLFQSDPPNSKLNVRWKVRNAQHKFLWQQGTIARHPSVLGLHTVRLDLLRYIRGPPYILSKCIMAPSCTHGFPINARTNEKVRLMNESNRLVRDKFRGLEVRGNDVLQHHVGFWCHPSHSSHVDDDLCKLCFGSATICLLANGPNAESIARHYAKMGIFLKEMTEKGMDTFFDELSQKGFGPEIIEASYKINTRAGLVKYVAGMIPCSCLNELRKEARTIPKMTWCWFCGKEDTKEKLFRCTRCKLVEYCSKECQVADWKSHKLNCNTLSKKK